MKNEKPIILRDWSRGTIRTLQNSQATPLAVNMDSDYETGSLVSRLGTNIVGVQAVASATCLGLSYFRDTTGSNHKLFGVFSDGVNNDVYDMSTGSKSLEDDTAGLKTRFCTFLNSIVRVNGTDVAKSFNGTSWVTSGGAFDEANMPLFHTVIEWKDRVYGLEKNSNILKYSSIADPDLRVISWISGNGQIEVEQEDGGGEGTALAKVPGYLLMFKERSMKRWDGNSTNPEDLISVGAPTQEAVCQGRGVVGVANQEGFWITNGGYPILVSDNIQDLWDAIPAANISSIATFCDEKYMYVYVGDITLGDNSYTNICFKFNLQTYLKTGAESWDVYSYYDDLTVFTWDIVSSEKVIVAGNKNGQAIQLNTGNTDYNGQPITWSVETSDLEFGSRGKVKEIDTLKVYTKNVRNGRLLGRTNSDRDKDWESLGNATEDVSKVNNKLKGNWFNYKLTGITDTGQVKFLGFEFPEESINVTENVK